MTPSWWLTLLLALAPVFWMIRHRGPGRPRSEGRLDGVLLLVALVCSMIGLTLAGVAVARTNGERREMIGSSPLPTTIEGCGITEQRTGGREATRTFELRCDVSYQSGTATRMATVRAGYSGSREPYERWMTAHPRGSMLELRLLRRGGEVRGLDQVVEATTTAAHARRRARGFAIAAALCLGLSRAVAARNRHSPDPYHGNPI